MPGHSASMTTSTTWCSSEPSGRSRTRGAGPLSQGLQPLVTTFDGHPWDWDEAEAMARTPRRSAASRWSAGKDPSFVPLRPERVVEVRYDHTKGDRFRHTAQFVRWRHDRDPGPAYSVSLRSPSALTSPTS